MKLSVGKEVLSYCTRCRMDLTHMIAAMAGDRILRVHCKTCKSDHNYRPAKGVKEPGAEAPVSEKAQRTRATTQKAPAVAVDQEWERLLAASRGKPLQTYSAATHFNAGDRIVHPTFGEGVAQKLIYPNKIEIVFQMDVKTLIHKP